LGSNKFATRQSFTSYKNGAGQHFIIVHNIEIHIKNTGNSYVQILKLSMRFKKGKLTSEFKVCEI